MKSNLYSVTLIWHESYFGEGTPSRTEIIESEINLELVEPEIIYRFLHRDNPDNIYDPEEVELKISSADKLTLTKEDKDEIMKELIMKAACDVADYLDIESEEDVNECFCTITVSPDELRDTHFMAGIYEEWSLINKTPKENLPLLIESLKTEAGKKRLSELLKG